MHSDNIENVSKYYINFVCVTKESIKKSLCFLCTENSISPSIIKLIISKYVRLVQLLGCPKYYQFKTTDDGRLIFANFCIL